MKFDILIPDDLGAVTGETVRAHERGADGVFVTEISHDPYLVATLAATAAEGLDVATKIAVAFARSPLVTATLAHDLQEITGDRFRLGLGTQVQAHIVKRFGMPWSPPAARMREYVEAMRAIWHAWRTGERLQFRGEHFQHTLMTPEFSPRTVADTDPTVWIAGVGPLMARTAVEVGDGLILHPFWTRAYFDEVMRPAIDRGLEAVGKERSAVEITAGGFVVTGRTAEELDRARETVRSRVAFYGSTPAYRPVLEVHGWGALGDALHELSVTREPDRWQRMTALVPDEVLAEFAVIATPDELPAALAARHGDYADRINVDAAWGPVAPFRAAFG
ncbi:MAG TPA: TIGR03617 family F420-dependent LLM class oxidoreductase [Pseudolysinimonas sp.]|nr:TIGR03617 family F420-dependent LLM class oxidoreductase [Pseudolysinimonas sp.]